MFAYRPAAQLTAMWEPLARYVEQLLVDKAVEIRVLNQDELEQAIALGELDVVFTNPTHYIRLRALNKLSGAIATQVTVENGIAVSSLGGVVFRRKDRADIRSLTDLKGKQVAIPGQKYLGGYIAQAALLRDLGIQLSDIRFLEVGNPHDKVVEAVAQGRADAGFVRSGILEKMRSEGSALIDQLEVIEPYAAAGFPFATSTQLYPEWAVATMPHLDDGTARRLASALLSLEHDHPAAQSAGIYGFTIPKDYRPVEDVMVALRVPPFEKAPNVSWVEFYGQHRTAVKLGFALGALILGAALLAGWLNRRLSDAKAEVDGLNKRFQDIADNVPGVIFQFRQRADGSAYYEWASNKIRDIYGCSAQDVAKDASRVFSVIHPDDLPAIRKSIQQSVDTLQTWHTSYRVTHPEKGMIWLEGSATPVRHADGSTSWSGFIRDITEMQASREALVLAAAVLNSTSDGVLILDQHGLVTSMNPAFSKMTGYRHPDFFGHPIDRLFALAEETWTVSSGHRYGEALWKTAEGRELPVLLSLSPVEESGPSPLHYVVAATDITDLKVHQAELERLAHYDALTGLPNRRLLEDRLEQAVAQARRTGEHIAVAMLDLDKFKPVNDTYGHEAGDQLLVEVSKRIKRVMRASDTVARLGGDEFALIFRDVQNPVAFQRVIDTIQEPVLLDAGQVQVSASMGVAYFSHQKPASGDQLMRQADMALYQSKEAGGNRFT
jgi:diguanylate cyclase (GGDEF)-like protein/PAS domain S-box-containing protein